jgi:hypothetical protein
MKTLQTTPKAGGIHQTTPNPKYPPKNLGFWQGDPESVSFPIRQTPGKSSRRGLRTRGSGGSGDGIREERTLSLRILRAPGLSGYNTGQIDLHR